MNEAALYQRANQVQRRDAEKILNEFVNVIQWRPDHKDSLIDIGCGSGDVVNDFIYPLMPENFTKLVGVDISEKMIHFARLNFSQPKVSFEMMDIKDDIPEKYKNQFDHVTSFYCLHWVQDQRRVLSNIYNLLNDDGDCLLVFLANNGTYDIHAKLAKKDKWSPYMADVDKFISPLHYSKEPVAEYKELLKEVGFSKTTVELREEIFIYEGLEILRKSVKAVSPFFQTIPSSLHEEFLDEYIQIVEEMDLGKKLSSGETHFSSPYNLLVVYAKKR